MKKSISYGTVLLTLMLLIPTISKAQITEKALENWEKLRAFHEVKLTTVFDSILLAKQQLTCNQYYNKLFSDYYKSNNYNGDRGIRKMALDINYSKETPCILINNKELYQFEFYELAKFKKIKSFVYDIGRPDIKGDSDEFGIYRFEAEY